MDADDRLRAAVLAQVAAHGRVRPPWMEFPGVDPEEIFWRMGGGEWHLMFWRRWWEEQHLDEPARLAFFVGESPPIPWLGWVAYAVWPELYSDDVDFEAADLEGVRRLEQHGIGTLAAWQGLTS